MYRWYLLLSASFALAIPDLGDLITLIGAFASSSLALIFPPIIEIVVFWNVPERTWFWKLRKPVWLIKDIAIMTLGIVGFAFGTYAATREIVKSFGTHHAKIQCGVCLAD